MGKAGLMRYLIVIATIVLALVATSCRELAVMLEADRHPFLTCVRHHESDRSGPHPYLGGYKAQNPTSTASGAYQFIDSTWRAASARAGHPGYAKAKHAPRWVQDAVALHVVKTGGKSAWNGTGC